MENNERRLTLKEKMDALKRLCCEYDEEWKSEVNEKRKKTDTFPINIEQIGESEMKITGQDHCSQELASRTEVSNITTQKPKPVSWKTEKYRDTNVELTMSEDGNEIKSPIFSADLQTEVKSVPNPLTDESSSTGIEVTIEEIDQTVSEIAGEFQSPAQTGTKQLLESEQPKPTLTETVPIDSETQVKTVPKNISEPELQKPLEIETLDSQSTVKSLTKTLSEPEQSKSVETAPNDPQPEKLSIKERANMFKNIPKTEDKNEAQLRKPLRSKIEALDSQSTVKSLTKKLWEPEKAKPVETATNDPQPEKMSIKEKANMFKNIPMMGVQTKNEALRRPLSCKVEYPPKLSKKRWEPEIDDTPSEKQSIKARANMFKNIPMMGVQTKNEALRRPLSCKVDYPPELSKKRWEPEIDDTPSEKQSIKAKANMFKNIPMMGAPRPVKKEKLHFTEPSKTESSPVDTTIKNEEESEPSAMDAYHSRLAMRRPKNRTSPSDNFFE